MSDYNFLMESRLSPAQLQVVNLLSGFAHTEGLNLYLAGGAVRDLSYGLQEIHDLDFAVEGDPQKILRHLEKLKPARRALHLKVRPGAVPKVLLERLRFDRRMESAAIQFASGVRAEVARCRSERHLRPDRPPQISPATIFEDLRRRDFAANALAISLHPYSRGLLLDPTNGAGDIERRELRGLQSRVFLDDPSRIYRAIRLGSRLGFKVEEKTQHWLGAALEARVWTQVDPALQGAELEAILREESPARILKAFEQRGLMSGLEKKLDRIAYDRIQKVQALVKKLPAIDPFLVYFHCLTSRVGPGYRKRLAQKILRDPELIRMGLNLEREAKKVARQLASGKAALPSNAYRLLESVPKPVLLFMLAFFPQAKVQSRLKNFLFKAPQVRARLPRAELEALGVQLGPAHERIIERVFFQLLDGKIKTSQQLTRMLRELAGIKEPPKAPAKVEKVPAPAKIESSATPAKIEKYPATAKKGPAVAPKPAEERRMAPQGPAAASKPQKTKGAGKKKGGALEKKSNPTKRRR